MFEFERGEPPALVAAKPREGRDRADVAPAFAQRCDLGRDVEILRLDADRRCHRG
jgi:hypothetical protein